MAMHDFYGGVYKITNLISGRVYVGASWQVRVRWSLHRLSLKNNRHHCPQLQEDWNRLGPDAFGFSVIEGPSQCLPNPESLASREDYWINYYSDQPAGIYNVKRRSLVKEVPEYAERFWQYFIDNPKIAAFNEQARPGPYRHGDPTEAEPPLDASPAKPMGS